MENIKITNNKSSCGELGGFAKAVCSLRECHQGTKNPERRSILPVRVREI